VAPDSKLAAATLPVNVDDYERLAEEALEPGPYGYFAGGAGAERTLRDNVAAFDRWRLRPRVLVDVSAPATATRVLGAEVSMPLFVAPVAFQRMAHPDGEGGMARAAAAAGTVMCVSTLATSTPAEVAAAAPGAPLWFQLYCFRDRGVTQTLIDEAVDSGYRAIVLTVDAPFGGRRERDLRSGFEIPPEVTVPSVAAAAGGDGPMTVTEIFSLVDPSLSWRDLEQLAGDCRLPVLVKGVLTAEDARLACEHGAAGVVVSNHGGRQLDGVAAALDALPEVVDAVEGRIEVLMDGGVRRGTDVVKALALGARAVLAGRAPLWGLTADGERGAARVLALLGEEIALALKLCGCPSPQAVTRAHVEPAGG
jgi:isopentenyl diphosphate isomerase/L-lactate dehydrogenase-like FMN-dependent dehydrogenase